MGALYKCDEQAGATCYDSSGNGNHGTITGTLSNVHGTTQDIYSWQNQVGYSDGGGGVFVPRDESDTTNDVLGSALDYTGRVPLPAKIIQSHCLDFNGSTEYVTWGAIGTSVKTLALRIKPDGVAGTDYLLWLNSTDYVTIVSGTVTLNGFSGATTAIYVDGAAGSTVTADWHSIVITSDTGFSLSNGYLGGNATNYYAGAVCDVRMSTTEWSAANAATYHGEGGEDSTLTVTHQWPCAEGASTSIFDVAYGTGTETLGVITGTVASMWSAQTQDVFAYNANQGFLLEASGRHVPAMLTGSTSAGGGAISNPAAACWNHPESHIDFDPYNTPELSGASNDYDPDVDDLALDGSQWVRRLSTIRWNDFVTYNAGLTGSCLSSANTKFSIISDLNSLILEAYKLNTLTGGTTFAAAIGSNDLEDSTTPNLLGSGTGRDGNCMTVTDDGVGTYDAAAAISIGVDAAWNTDNAHSVAAWVKLVTKSTTTDIEIVELQNNGGASNYWNFNYDPSGDRLIVTDNTTTLTDSAAPTLNTWYLCVFTVDVDGNAFFYVCPEGGDISTIRKQTASGWYVTSQSIQTINVCHTVEESEETHIDELLFFGNGTRRLFDNEILHLARENYISSGGTF